MAPARNRASFRDRGDGEFAITHSTLRSTDLDRLGHARHLLLWNVKMPEGFLAQLDGLEFLDYRGGSASDLSVVDGCRSLSGLVVNQVRGLSDLDAISALTNLRILTLYGLSRVEALPAMVDLGALRRLELGQLRRLSRWSSILDPPGLEELVFLNKLHPDLDVLAELGESRRSLQAFTWSAPDEPRHLVEAVTSCLDRPPAKLMRPEDWYWSRR